MASASEAEDDLGLRAAATSAADFIEVIACQESGAAGVSIGGASIGGASIGGASIGGASIGTLRCPKESGGASRMGGGGSSSAGASPAHENGAATETS